MAGATDTPTRHPSAAAYDPPPLPKKGEWSEQALYESVGRALTAWERFDRCLGILFHAFVSPTLYHLPIERAYGTVSSFAGKVDMAEAAAEAYFLSAPDEKNEEDWRIIKRDAMKFATIRNNIAHGAVTDYTCPAGHVSGLALLPSEFATKKTTLRGDIDLNVAWAAKITEPKYAYGCAEIDFFAKQFNALQTPVRSLQGRIVRYFRFKEGEPS